MVPSTSIPFLSIQVLAASVQFNTITAPEPHAGLISSLKISLEAFIAARLSTADDQTGLQC